MPKPIVILFTLLVLVLVATAVVAINPVLILRPVLQSQLRSAGFQLHTLNSVQVGTSSSNVALLTAESGNLHLSAQNIRVDYSLAQLLDGEVAQIHMESLDVSFNDTGGGGENMPLDLESLYRSIATLPLSALTAEAATIQVAEEVFSARLNLQTSPLSLSVDGNWQAADIAVSATAEAVGENQLRVSSLLSHSDTLLLEGDQEVEISDTELRITGGLSIHADNLQSAAALAQGTPANWAIVNETVSLEHQLVIDSGGSGPQLQSLLASLDSGGTGGSGLQLLLETDQSRLVAQASLPLTITVTANTVNDNFDVQLTDSYQNFSWLGDEFEIHGETNFSNIHANCETWDRCVTTAAVQLVSPAWQYSGANGEGLRATAELKIEQLPGLTEFSASNTSLAFDTAHYQQWQVAGDLDLEELFLILGEVDRGRVTLNSNDLTIDADKLSLIDPALTSTINYFDDALAGSVDVSLGGAGINDQALLQGAFNHSLSSLQGHAELTLNPIQFSESTPLSSLIEQQWLSMDVVAGTLSGATRIDWEIRDEAQQVRGPISLLLEGLSGHVEDTLLVGVNTQATGEFRDWTEIVSTPGLNASIDVIDIGLPTQNVRWQYSFNSAEREILINELNAQLFGGRVEIADFRLKPSELDQDLTVVLSRLDLETIVGLAGYPQLFVDGLISGYIPLRLENGKVLIDDGLVGALRPGGNIRYTPGSESTVASQTMQLVNDALSNYQYETLDTRVFYDESGDLLMEVQLQGINPDMNGGQPINLNVNVTDNIPSLLRSLKAGQEISERLEQRLQNR